LDTKGITYDEFVRTNKQMTKHSKIELWKVCSYEYFENKLLSGEVGYEQDSAPYHTKHFVKRFIERRKINRTAG
jgi:hypothetical protein